MTKAANDLPLSGTIGASATISAEQKQTILGPGAGFVSELDFAKFKVTLRRSAHAGASQFVYRLLLNSIEILSGQFTPGTGTGDYVTATGGSTPYDLFTMTFANGVPTLLAVNTALVWQGGTSWQPSTLSNTLTAPGIDHGDGLRLPLQIGNPRTLELGVADVLGGSTWVARYLFAGNPRSGAQGG